MSWANSNNGNRRRADELAAFLGLAGSAIEVQDLGAAAAVTQSRPYRSAADVPRSWRVYAMQLVEKLQQRLGSDHEISRRIAREIGNASVYAVRQTATVRVWVLPSGKLARLTFDDVSADVADAMRALFGDSDIGAPPHGMLQPLHIRLSLGGTHPQEQLH